MLGSTRTAWWCLLFLMAGAWGAAQAQAQGQAQQDADSGEKVYDVGPGITQPRITKQVMPHYPDTHGVKLEGSITIALVVSSGGMPEHERVVKGIEKDIDQSALDAVSQWRFDPAKKDGKAVAVRIAVELEFHSM